MFLKYKIFVLFYYYYIPVNCILKKILADFTKVSKKGISIVVLSLQKKGAQSMGGQKYCAVAFGERH